MNLVLLEYEDFVREGFVRVMGRRLDYVRKVHRAALGAELRVGILGGKTGLGRIERIDGEALEMTVRFEAEPPEPLPVRLVLALPRPKVLNRTIAAAVSMGIREIDLINAWRVEKAYWGSPRLSAENLRLQAILGLEQAGDTILPTIRQHELFVPFVRDVLPKEVGGRLGLVADPGGEMPCPRDVGKPLVLAIGPEGGFIERELATFREVGFTPVSLGRRILRVETALAYLVGRLF
jgi:16S rRNA (uracil1498-N3)-methyltransferase